MCLAVSFRTRGELRRAHDTVMRETPARSAMSLRLIRFIDTSDPVPDRLDLMYDVVALLLSRRRGYWFSRRTSQVSFFLRFTGAPGPSPNPSCLMFLARSITCQKRCALGTTALLAALLPS